MKLIVGLGNPGPEYAATRHNVGYRVVERLAERWSLGGWKSKFQGLVADGAASGDRVVLLRPTAYMNLSGASVLAAMQYLKLELPALLVVGDDLDLPLGQIRVRASGSSGGQRGFENVIVRLGSTEFARVRLGIGRPARGSAANYVLEAFHASERDAAEEMIGRAADAAECWLSRGVAAAMNQFNRSENREP